VVAEAGSAGEAAIQGDENLAKADYFSKSVQTDCLMEVAAGTADAAVLDLTLANAMIGEGTDYASLKIVDELNAEEYGVAFRKGSDAAAAVDAAFDALKADGTMQALAEKYERWPTEPGVKQNDRWVCFCVCDPWAPFWRVPAQL
jgi:polar amino acid transport system substrate-binding protein